jgi:hypothetical protein
MEQSQKFSKAFDSTNPNHTQLDDRQGEAAIPLTPEISPRNSTSSIQEELKPAVIQPNAEVEVENEEENCPEHHGIYWKVPFKMLTALGIGIVMSGAHSGWYHHLNSSIVGTPAQQENNIRFVVVITYTRICVSNCSQRG